MSDWRIDSGYTPPTPRPVKHSLSDVLGSRRAIAIAEVRDGRGSWGAIQFHRGHGTGTDYFQYAHGWHGVSWEQIPKHTYRKLRAALKEDAKLGAHY